MVTRLDMANNGDSHECIHMTCPYDKEELNIDIPYEKKQIAAKVTRPLSTPKGYGLILTHGAGGDMDTPLIVDVSHAFAKAGYHVLRFTCKGLNIGYRIKVYTTILEYFKTKFGEECSGCFLAGRSMGSRAAVGCANMVLENESLQSYVKGIICLAYPLHPVNKAHNLRDQPLYELRQPCLFVSGDNDSMTEKELLTETVLKMKTSHKEHWIVGGNHSLTAKGRTDGEIPKEICETCLNWCKYITCL